MATHTTWRSQKPTYLLFRLVRVEQFRFHWTYFSYVLYREYLLKSLDYEAYPERKDTSRVGRQGNLLCLLWQHCRRSWLFTCEPCSFDSDRTGFVWVRRVWNGSADPKSRQIRGAFHHMISQSKMRTHRKEMSFWTPLWLEMKHGVFTTLLNPSKLWKSSTTMMRCKKKSWRGSKGRRQTSMTRGYGSWFQDLINVWTMPATMEKNKVMYRQFIDSVTFVN